MRLLSFHTKVFAYLILLIVIIGSDCYAQKPHRWEQDVTLTNHSLNGIGILGRKVVGNNGKIFSYSTLSGWVEQNSGTLLDLNFISPTQIQIAVGNQGTVLLYSSNNWTSLNAGISENLYSVAVTRIPNISRYITAVGDNGKIIRSQLSPIEWNTIPSPVTHNLRDIRLYDDYNSWLSDSIIGFIVGDNGTILKSTDHGESWFSLNSGVSNHLYSIYRVSKTDVIISGSNGLILKSSNAGDTWNPVPSGIDNDLLSISGKPMGVSLHFVLAVGKQGSSIVSFDGGNTWDIDTIINGFDFNSVILGSGMTATAVTSTGTIYQRKLDPLYNPLQFLSGNQIKNGYTNTGVFNRDTRINNTPGFEWPINSGKFAFFSSGLSIAALYNNQLRMVSASYTGEYELGFVNQSGKFETDNRFKIYKVSSDNSPGLNWDYDNWELMVPFGAPFEDVNHNGQFDSGIDIPGVINSAQTIFMHMTDANPESHFSDEGFGGGTLPLFAEVALTSWSYDSPELQNVQFTKWDIKNSSSVTWQKVYFGLFSDPDLGDYYDDYIGCDTNLHLGYVYNATNQDGTGAGNSYGKNPPAAGIMFLKTFNDLGMTSFGRMHNSHFGIFCEKIPYTSSEAYLRMKGLKNDNTPWVIPNTSPPEITKFTFSGEPESGTGWTEFSGSVYNCGGSLTGQTNVPSHLYDRQFLMSSGSEELNLNPGEGGSVIIAQLIARGSNNLNSVTRLKEYADSIKTIFQTINISSPLEISPERFYLYQNYPNPFNPTTNIRFDIHKQGIVILKIYDILGKELLTLVNESLGPGSYKYQFTNDNYQLASGVYFYRIEAGEFVEAKRMILLK